jgi:hypothetical protein
MTFRTVGIIGNNFSGSTILSRLFSTIENVFPAGELHWLIDAPATGHITTRAGWPATRFCVTCGHRCPIFTKEFISQKFEPLELYRKVAKQADTNILISSDKLPGLYSRLVEPKTMDGIVIFKRPEADIASHMRNEKWSFEKAMNIYSNNKGIIKWATHVCKNVVVVFYENLALHPNRYMRAICDALDIPCNGDVTKFDEAAYHHIGGNPGANASTRIILDQKWEKELTSGQKKIIINNHQLQSIFFELIRRSIAA